MNEGSAYPPVDQLANYILCCSVSYVDGEDCPPPTVPQVSLKIRIQSIKNSHVLQLYIAGDSKYFQGKPSAQSIKGPPLGNNVR